MVQDCVCVCVCVSRSVELLELFGNSVGFIGCPDATLCKSDCGACGCNGGVSKGLLFIPYCCLLYQLIAVGSPLHTSHSSGYCLYSGHHGVSSRLFVMIVIKIQSLECVWVTVGGQGQHITV